MTGLAWQSVTGRVPWPCMSTVQEIEAAIPGLSRADAEKLRQWLEDYLEDHAELTDEVKAHLDESRREIADGQFTVHQP